MRVLHLTAEFPPFIWGGLGTAVGGLATASARAGLEVKILLVGDGEWFWSYGHQVRILESPEPEGMGLEIVPAREAEAVASGVRLARWWQPDVLHVHPVELGPIAREIRRQTGVPIVYTVHSLNSAEYEIGHEPPEILGLWRAQQELIAGADRVLVLSRDERRLLLETCPSVRGRVRILGNGIDDPGAPGRAGREARKEPVTILYAGRFVDRKGIRDLFAAIPAVLERAPDSRFVLVGGHGTGAAIEVGWLPPGLEPYRERIHFTGWLLPDSVAEWYRAADILVVPSWYEPFGMVVLEGMLHGLPIVATRVGGPASILKHGRTGVLVPPRDASALASALLRLVESPKLRQGLGAAAAREVRRTWLWPQIVEKMAAVYAEVASGRAQVNRRYRAAAWASRAERSPRASWTTGPIPQ
ncbi:MAG TPA: glycosyltransferase family 4 protein [Thermoanaerobaculia bacterium]|jgi:glycosyltransferase involved in cell wall biosynthesis|nr:glycosyltransferase family 4 protein [Thermoanaerobaculia bacterium]